MKLIDGEALMDEITNDNILKNMDSVEDSELNRYKRAMQRIVARACCTPLEECGDCVSREDVIGIIEEVCPIYKNDYRYILRDKVKELPPVTPKLEESEDCVSRKDAIEAVNNLLADYIPILYGKLVEIPLKCARVLHDLPPVTAKPRTGVWKREWLIDHFEEVCSKCGCGEDYESDYCPNCGAKMGG